MKTTKKIEKAWICGIIENLSTDKSLLNESGNPFETTAANIRACSGGYYKTPQEAARHFLQGCGLHGFPIYTEEHEQILKNWGFKPTPRMLENFWSVSASLLIEVLREHEKNI